MAWLYVALASVLDVAWATLIKRYGLSNPFVIAAICCIVISVPLLMNSAMKTIPLGTAYGVFVGLAAIGVLAMGVLAFGESTSLLRLFFLGLIVVGIIGLRLLENPAAPTA